MIDIYDYLCFDGIERSWTIKVEYILKRPCQRRKYSNLISQQEKINFFCDHFVMNDLAVRQLTKACSRNEDFASEFTKRVEYIIDLFEDHPEYTAIEIPTPENIRP